MAMRLSFEARKSPSGVMLRSRWIPFAAFLLMFVTSLPSGCGGGGNSEDPEETVAGDASGDGGSNQPGTQGTEQPAFTLSSFRAGAFPTGIAVGDIDGDGAPDIVSLDAGGATALVSLAREVIGANGAAPDYVTFEVPVGRLPRDVLLEDLDGDGNLDIATANFGPRSLEPNDVSILRGLGNGEFSEPVMIPVGRGPSALTAADFDNDGNTDLAVANVFSNEIALLVGDGQGGFELGEAVATPARPQDLVAGDFNGDGNTDMVAALLLGKTDVAVMLGDGNGGFISDVAAEPVLGNEGFEFDGAAVAIAASDLDADGALDLALVDRDANTVAVRFGNGDGSFGDAIILSSGFPIQVGPRDVAIGDVDGNGLDDVVAANIVSDNIAVFLAGGPRVFLGPVTYTLGPAPYAITLADLDQNGSLDVAGTTGAVSVLSNASASVAPAVISVVPSSGPPTGGTPITVRGLNFQAGATVTIGGQPAADVVVLPASQLSAVTPAGMAGVADIVVSNPDGESATLFDAFTFTASPAPADTLQFTRLVFCDGDFAACTTAKSKDVDLGDVDADGYLDAVIVQSRGSGLDQLFRNTGTVKLETRDFLDGLNMNQSHRLAFELFQVEDIGLPVADKAQYDVQVVDIDGDGDLDAIGAHASPIRLLINDGTGTFTDEAGVRIYTATNVAAGLMPSQPPFAIDDVDVGDVDNDGDFDIAVANRDDMGSPLPPGERDFLLLNNLDSGSDTFDVNFTLFSDTGLVMDVTNHDVELADIDNDGDLDVLLSGQAQGAADLPSVLENRLVEDGALSFNLVAGRINPAPMRGCEALETEYAAGPLDFNHDGFVDIYCGRVWGTDSIYINRGVAQPGYFDELAGVPFPTVGMTYGVDFGDLDLDGRLDFVQGDYSPGEPMIFLNRPDPADPALPSFVAVPEPTMPGARGDANTFWQSNVSDSPGAPLVEPDTNLDIDRNGFLESMEPIMTPAVGDLDNDGDLDIFFALGDGASRTNRIYLNNTLIAPPEVTCDAAESELWPPNHQMVDIGFDFTTSAICDEDQLDIVVSITSDEHPSDEPGAGGANHCPDAVVAADDSVELRSERSGSGDGRVYTVTVQATDLCGGVGSCSVNVSVPHDQGPGGGAVDSGQVHDPTVCP